MSNSEVYIDFKDIGNKNIKELIQQHGYLVITNVIGQDKADNYIGEMCSKNNLFIPDQDKVIVVNDEEIIKTLLSNLYSQAGGKKTIDSN